MNVYNKCFLRYNYFILDTFHPDILYLPRPTEARNASLPMKKLLGEIHGC
jgi:hypothetical protein